MYNRKSKASAILAIITALLVVGFIVLLPSLLFSKELELGEIIAVLLVGIVYGFLPLYASAIPFVIVALVFGIKMLKQQSRQKLISLNKRMLITTCVLLPILMVGITICSNMVTGPTGFVILIYAIVTALAYLAGLVAQIVAIVMLKKSPEEIAPAVTE